MSEFKAVPTGVETEGTHEYRVFYERNGARVSPWHGIPLRDGAVFNAVIEIPRGTQEKMEISKDEPLNPIKQDVKKGQLRLCTYKGGYPFNYGAFPQTYEDPDHVDPHTQAKGDNDPLDVCEIGAANATRGQVKQVKILGCLAMIDEGETDWKIVCVDVNDPKAAELNDIADVDKAYPGTLETTLEWFRMYKTVDGKPENKFAFDSQYKDRHFALQVVNENHEFWKRLISGELPAGGHSLA